MADTLEFSVALHMRHFKHLQKRIARGETIPAEEMEASYLPLPNDYQAVKLWLKAQGFTITQEDASRVSIFAKGTLEQIEKAFQTKMVGVTFDGAEYPAATEAPSLPASVAAPVLGVNGLQPFHHLHKHNSIRKQATGVTYKINDILTCYDAKNSGVTGKGQTIAILIDTTPSTSDLTKFWTANSVAQSLSNVYHHQRQQRDPARRERRGKRSTWSGPAASPAAQKSACTPRAASRITTSTRAWRRSSPTRAATPRSASSPSRSDWAKPTSRAASSPRIRNTSPRWRARA